MIELDENLERMLEEWISEHGDTVVHIAYQLTSDAELAQNIAHKVFLRAYKAYKPLPEDITPETRLVKITLRACKNMRRLILFKRALPKPKKNHEPENMLMINPARDALVLALRKMPYKYARAIVLHYFCEFNAEVISKLCGCPQKTIEAALERGRGILEIKLKDENEDTPSPGEPLTSEDDSSGKTDGIHEYYAAYIGDMPDIELDARVKASLHDFLYKPARARLNYKIIAIISSSLAALCIAAIAFIFLFGHLSAADLINPAKNSGEQHAKETASPPPTEEPEHKASPDESAPPKEEEHSPSPSAAPESKPPETNEASPLPEKSPAVSPESVTPDIKLVNTEYSTLNEADKARWIEDKAKQLLGGRFGVPKKAKSPDSKKEIYEDEAYRYTFDKNRTHPFISLDILDAEKGKGEMVEDKDKLDFVLSMVGKVLNRYIDSSWTIDFKGKSFEVYHYKEQKEAVLIVTFNDSNVLVTVTHPEDEV